jgi:chromosomal replication initiation ATPase DnaA
VQQSDTVHERSRLNPILTFDNFVTGKANQLARAAAIQVANNPASRTTRSICTAASAWARPT